MKLQMIVNGKTNFQNDLTLFNYRLCEFPNGDVIVLAQDVTDMTVHAVFSYRRRFDDFSIQTILSEMEIVRDAYNNEIGIHHITKNYSIDDSLDIYTILVNFDMQKGLITITENTSTVKGVCFVHSK